MFCSGGSELSGGSNQTDNAKILISAVYPSGVNAEGAFIIIRRKDFTPSGVLDSTNTGFLNNSGSFISENLDTGIYLVEIKDSSHLSIVTEFVITDTTDTLFLPTDTLTLPGSLSGKLETDGYCGNVSILGTEYICPVDSFGIFSFNTISAYKNYRLKFKSDNESAAIQIFDSVKVIEDSSTQLEIVSKWLYEKKITINTSSSGGNISESITNFPLLIQIDGDSSFNFDEAKDNGEDIRFFDQNNKRLNFEFETYNKSNSYTAIWILVPLIEGNNDSQFVTMKWGNEDAVYDSSFSLVFSESNNFKGVWHFGTNTKFSDATDGKNHGTAIGSTSISEFGYIGDGCHVSEQNSYVKIANESNFDLTDNITISAWIKADSLSDYTWNDAVLSKGKDAYSLSRGIGKDVFSISVMPSGETTAKTADGFTQLNDLKYHYITGTKKGDSLIIYSDGVEEGRLYQSGSIATNDHPLIIGAKSILDNPIDVFHGIMDEVRISNSSRSAAWIKLCYESQKVNQNVTKFK